MVNRRGKMETVTDFIFLGSKNTVDHDCSHEIRRCLLLGRKAVTNLDSILKSSDILLLTKIYSQNYGFSSSHIQMWELDHKESWAPKNWCFQIVVLEKIPEGPLDYKEIKPVNPKGNQSWIIMQSTDVEVEAPIPDVKNSIIGKDPDTGKDWRQKDKGAAEDEMVRWHHRLNGHEFKQIQGDSEGREAWRAAVHGVTKSQKWIGDWITATTRKSSKLFYCSKWTLGSSFPGLSWEKKIKVYYNEILRSFLGSLLRFLPICST